MCATCHSHESAQLRETVAFLPYGSLGCSVDRFDRNDAKLKSALGVDEPRGRDDTTTVGSQRASRTGKGGKEILPTLLIQ